MPQCVVIADDLTGANGTGVLLKKMDYKTYTVLNTDCIEDADLSNIDCVISSTDSRAISKKMAYNKVYEAVNFFKNDKVKVYAKRIDSTLRGNIGSETDAMLDALGEKYIAIAAPCFPASGRTVIGGYMLVNGLPLHKTEVAIDPKTPVKISDVADIFRQQSKYKVASIQMNDMMNGRHHLAQKINELVKENSRIIVIDCITQEDLDLIADAVITSRRKIITVDSGVLTATIARKIIVPEDKKEKKKILAVIGSVNSVTKNQMEELWLTQRTVYNIFVNTEKLLSSEEDRCLEIARVVEEVLEESKFFDVLTVTTDGIYQKNRIDFSEMESGVESDITGMTDVINTSFAEITYKIFSENKCFKGLYSSGGDITVAICRLFKASGLCLLDEVLPLAAYGKFKKGEFDGVDIVTKGGMVGEKDAANKCITYLREKLFM